MYDTFEPFQGVQKQNFIFIPSRYEMWKGGKMVASGKTRKHINANVVSIDGVEKMEVTFEDVALQTELSAQNIFDEFITGKDRLQLITIPANTNSNNMGIIGFQTILGATRNSKDFSGSEPYCCNIFLQKGRIVKITFSYSCPEKLLEFYDDSSEDVMNFEFSSSDHIRYENGIHISGPHGGARRLIKVEPNITGGEGYSVSMYNLDGDHPIWKNNIQMTHKQMKIVEDGLTKIVLRGYGHDTMGGSFADYGLTILMNSGRISKCILHLHDRNVNIEYMP